MVTINFEKKHLFLISAVFVFLVGVGFVMSYTIGNKNLNPAINPGHSIDSISGYFVEDDNLRDTFGRLCANDGTNCANFVQVYSTNNQDFRGSSLDVNCPTGYKAIACSIGMQYENADLLSCYYKDNFCKFYWHAKGATALDSYGVRPSCTCARQKIVGTFTP